MTKGKSKAEARRRLRKRGTGGSTKMLGKLTRYNYGTGPKTKNGARPIREDDTETELR
jgi:hypothetical protein